MPSYTHNRHRQPGEKTGADIEADHRAWSNAQPATGGCLFCPDFKPVGTCAEVKAACDEHRQTFHPELGKKKRKRKPTFSGLLVYSQNLTEDERDEINSARAKRLRLLGIEGVD